MLSINTIIGLVEEWKGDFMKPKHLADILDVSSAWIYKKNLPLEVTYKGSTGKKEKKYYVIRKSEMLKWLSDVNNQDKIVKAHYSSQTMREVRSKRK